MEQTYALSGMRCQGCARKLETALAAYGEAIEIDFPSASVRLANANATLEQMNARLAEMGAYALSPLPAAAQPFQSGDTALQKSQGIARYYPLLLVAAYLAVASLAGAQGIHDWMWHFMAGFFLVFSFFKLLNVRAFADAYALYDLVAAKWHGYGLVYPFIELALGLAYLFDWQRQLVLWITLAVAILGGAGVLRSMMRRQTIRCACLGAVLDVPVSTVTLVEDFGMAAMAIAMLAL